VCDLLIIATWLFGRAAPRVNFSVRLVAYFAVANLVTSGMAIINDVDRLRVGDAVCVMFALLEWYSTLASWLWTGAIAVAFRVCFQTGTIDLSAIVERKMHAVCWLAPAALLGAALAMGASFGSTDPSTGHCGWIDTHGRNKVADASADVVILGCLLTVTLVDCWAFVSVYLILRNLRKCTASEPLAAQQPARNQQMWRTFTAYVVAFVCTQGPRGLWDAGRDARPGALSSAQLVGKQTVFCLSYSHGFCNAVVWGMSNKQLWQRWRSLPAVCCELATWLSGHRPGFREDDDFD
jgi:hypothetical protein